MNASTHRSRTCGLLVQTRCYRMADERHLAPRLDPYDRDVVLRALVRAVADYREQGRAPDLVFATGDIAHASTPEEYLLATKFFDDLLAAAGLDKHRQFVIPGNHDVDREFGSSLIRTLESREHADTYFRPDFPKPQASSCAPSSNGTNDIQRRPYHAG